jgi:hypothetical protein
MAFDKQMFGSGLGGFLGGLFGDSGKPYDKAMEQYQNFANQAQGTQQPYLNAGQGAIGDYQTWLKGQQDPSKFINSIMGQYQQSPYNQYLQQQAQNAGINAGSASGLTGSTPLMQQMQQNAANIGQQGMNDWLSNVLGINTQYGQGQQNLMTGGQQAANALTNLYSDMGKNMGEQMYNKEASKQNNFWNTLGSVGSMFGSFF